MRTFTAVRIMSSVWDSTRSRFVLLAVVALLIGDIAALVRLTPGSKSPEEVAAAWTRAVLAGDCDRLFALSTPASRDFFDAVGGCPLGGPVDFEVGATSIRESRSDAAVVIVQVKGPGVDEPIELLVVRPSSDDPWRVEARAAEACASIAGQPPQPGDCEPLGLPEP